MKHRTPMTHIALLAGIMTGFAACSSSGASSEESSEEIIPDSFGAYEHVIILGVDGGGAFFSNTVTPNTFKICKSGASSDSVLTSDPTISAQCWGSMLHGVLPEFHRLSNDIVSNRHYDPESPYPSIFRITREEMPDAPLASFCNWDPINYGIIEDNLGVVKGTGDDPSVTSQVIEYLESNSPTLLFVQFDSVDGAGHSYGYGTQGHLSQLTAVDAMIKQIYDAVVKKGIIAKTLFIITADHGGTPEGSHGGDTDAERYVYLGIRGTSVEYGSRIKDVEVRDIPAIAAYALGLDIPDTWTGRVPSGVFPGVTAKERNVVEIPVSDTRKHTTESTPSLSEVKNLLKDHSVLAYFPFDGNVDDSYGQVETSKSGKLYFYNAYFGKGVALDDGYVTLKNASVGTGSFSVSFWIKADAITGDPAIISNKNWNNGSYPGFVLSLRPSDIKFNVGNSDARMDCSAALPLDYNRGWMHVILTVDRTGNKVSFYYDFKLDQQYDIPSELTGGSYDSLDFNIGQDGTGHYANNLPAQIDELIITKDVLKESDIAALKAFYHQ